jgi:hypothetical protein
MLYRPGDSDAQDLQMAEALSLARRDTELGSWLAKHNALQSAIRRKFKQVPVPGDLSARVLAGQKIRRPIIWWQQPSILAAAAAIVLLFSLAVYWSQPREKKGLLGFGSRMASTALRNYVMDLETNDLSQIRAFLAEHKAPANYVLPKPLEKITATGCVITSWHGKQVSMLCFNSGRPMDPGEKSDLFLFVIDRAALPDAPPTSTPVVAKVNKLTTASWSLGDKVYLLGGFGDEDYIRKFL